MTAIPTNGAKKVMISAAAGGVRISSPAAGSEVGPNQEQRILVRGADCENFSSVEGNTLFVSDDCFEKGGFSEVQLPRNFGVAVGAQGADVALTGYFSSIEVMTTNGDVDLHNVLVKGDVLQVKTTGGNVDLRDVEVRNGPVRLSTDSGTVAGRLDAAWTLSVQTKSGDTALELGSTIDKIHISATSGDVDLSLASPFVWTGSSAGRREIDKSPGATKPGVVNTTSGAVRIKAR